MTFSRIAALSGLAFVVLAVANGILLGNPPFPQADLVDVREYVENGEARHKAALLVLHVAFGFAVIFFAGIVKHLRASDTENGEAWGIAALGGGILGGAAAVVGNTLFALLVYRAGSGLDDSVLGMLKDGELIAFSAMGVPIAAVAVSVAVPTLRHGVLPVWYGVLSLIAATTSVLGTIAMVLITAVGGWLSSIATAGLGVWVLATSLVLLQRSS